MMKGDSIFPPGTKILVTGANGYIASHVISILLDLGLHVRGTVRTSKPWLEAYFQRPDKPDIFETVVVPDLVAPDALDLVLEGISGIVHLANHMSFTANPHAISRAQDMNVNILETAKNHKTVRRVVLTSSSCAAFYPTVNGLATVDHDSWNEYAVQTALHQSCPPEMLAFIVHGACKVQAERESWKWMEQNHHPFVLNTVLPYWTVGMTPWPTRVCLLIGVSLQLGKILHPQIGGSSMSWMKGILQGDTSAFQLPPQWFVDVEDVARLHVVALLSDQVQAERLFAFASPFTWADIVHLLRKLQPDNPLIPAPPKNAERIWNNIPPVARAEGLLQDAFGRAGWTSLEESLAAGVRSLA
ncbi:NAD dependent epimerase/dehydratase [Penicillium canariense]|uniref:NAD dependent epimerase/dehydratase n=1 Tax=Penicillium canariense TaxID=189055 RepID=A0A9W9HX43_9EURO|nr:NAD dependent epimerase/dehydratase [Penicillium canariense]KAJ5159371.1 NAD dependent epimerase/dehydratase [Penicillium canariense]